MLKRTGICMYFNFKAHFCLVATYRSGVEVPLKTNKGGGNLDSVFLCPFLLHFITFLISLTHYKFCSP